MIGTGERDEALGMLGRREDMRGVLDADGLVGRRMEDQQRLAQLRDALGELLLGDVSQEFPADAERPPGERHLDLAVLADGVDLVPEQMRDMAGIAGRGDGHHRPRLRDRFRRGEHRGAAEAVADQQRRRPRVLRR